MTIADCEVLVVGAGISGLTTAFRLRARGIDVAVIEAADRTGGVIASVLREGVLYERGPNSILDTNPRLDELLDDLEIRSERIDASAHSAKRFVVHRGKLVALPTSVRAFFATPLFSARAKLALLREPFVRAAPPSSEETIAQFVVRRLGREVLDYAIEPFVAGIYAGDPDELSLPASFPRLHALEQRYGSLIKGQIMGARERATRAGNKKKAATSFSFVRGLQTLTDALAAGVQRIHTQTRATKLQRASTGAITVTVKHDGAAQEINARAVILTVPADRAAALVGGFAPDAARALAAIPYAPVASVASVYRRRDVAHPLDGFGFLAPRIERRGILGTLFSSTMFGGRARDDEVLLTTFVGGQRNPGLLSLAGEELAKIVNAELAALVGACATPHSVEVTRWPRAIPQYTLGHLERMRGAAEAEHALCGLFLCASYRDGVAVGDRITCAFATADRVAAHLDSRRTSVSNRNTG